MMPAATIPATPVVPLRSPFLVIFVGWLIPGAGHFLLGRRGRAALIFASVVLAFTLGVLMRGPLFQPPFLQSNASAADVLSRLIQWGGFIGDLCAGLPYLLASWLGYAPPDVAGHVPDYGSKFIVAAGLLNILAIVDAYEITTRQKD
jgi:hypothetical protein